MIVTVALLTCHCYHVQIGGIGMIIVIVGGCHDNPSCMERFAGTLMLLSVVSGIDVNFVRLKVVEIS